MKREQGPLLSGPNEETGYILPETAANLNNLARIERALGGLTNKQLEEWGMCLYEAQNQLDEFIN